MVCRYFEDQLGEKGFKIQLCMYRSYPKELVYAVSTTNMAFEAAQAQKETCLFFQAHDHDRLLFWQRLQWKNFWMEGNRHQQNEPAGHQHRLQGDGKKHVSARQGLYLKFSRNRRAGCMPLGKEVTRSICLTNRKRFFFFSQQKFKAEQSFPVGSSHYDWVERSTQKGESSAEPQERSDRVERSAKARATLGWAA